MNPCRYRFSQPLHIIRGHFNPSTGYFGVEKQNPIFSSLKASLPNKRLAESAPLIAVLSAGGRFFNTIVMTEHQFFGLPLLKLAYFPSAIDGNKVAIISNNDAHGL